MPTIGDLEPLPEWPDYRGATMGKPVAKRFEDVSVGMVAFVYTENRTYHKRWNGRYYESFGGPIERYNFVPVLIAGETRVSWLTEGRWPGKYRKRPQPHDARLYGLEDVEDALWLRSHRYKVARFVEQCKDADTLRRVATVVGYRAEDWT